MGSDETSSAEEGPPTVTPEGAAGARADAAEVHKSKAHPRHHRKKSGRGHRLLVGFTILMLASAAGGLGWLYYNTRLGLDALQGRLQQQEARAAALEGRSQQLQQQLAEVDGHLNQSWQQIQQQLQSQQQETTQLKENLVTLQEQRAGGNAWKVAEVEYLLEIANHNLQLRQDPVTALTALKAAADRLKRLADPRLTEIRARVIAEVQALEAVQATDISDLVLELSAMEESVDDLPLFPESKFVFAPGNREKPASEDGDGNDMLTLLRKAWDDINNWIVPRRVDEPVQPLLPPDQAYFLLQNLKLKLAAMRLAALRGDDDNFHRLGEETEAWVLEYFDPAQPAVAAMAAALAKYKSFSLKPAAPDISASLLALRNWRKQRNPD